MKKSVLLITTVSLVLVSSGQVVLNEVYTDPGNGKNEFFELYNTSVLTSPMSLDNYTIVTYFEGPGKKGFYVMDLPNLTVNPKGFFVGASALPFSYQGVVNSTAADFNWNSAAFTSNNGYVKEWLYQSNNLLDGNLFYDEVNLPANFNDFFFRRTANGASYTIFLYKNGLLINALIFGTGGLNSVIPAIITMPPLFVDMTATSPDFTIDFSIYGTVPLETVSQDAGSDNGFIREADGLCGGWTKSSAQVQHTPQLSNGDVDRFKGFITATAIIQKGTAVTGSKFIYDVIAAPVTSFPIELQVYKDNGTNLTRLDGSDVYVESNTETVVTDGPFTTIFTPYDMNMLLVVISNAGCIDKVLSVPNVDILPVKLIYFQGNLDGNKVYLQWKVGENESANRFEIERSCDGINFVTVGTVNSTEKTTEEIYSYSETINSKGKLFYRLKIVNKIQMVSYSTIVPFQTRNDADKNNFSILNNPAKDKLNISFQSSYNQQIKLNVYDPGGKLQMKQSAIVNEGSNVLSLSLNASFTPGIYIIELVNGTERYAAKFIKQ